MENEKVLPPWADEMPEGAFITCGPTYKVGGYFDRFHQDVFKNPAQGEMKYYFFDPTEHGFPADRKYPLIIFLHGVGNALEGDICINFTGAEFFAKDDYQNDFGGAYLLIPIANERREEPNESITGFWDDSYVEPLYDLINHFIREKTPGVTKKILLGNSAGGLMSYKMVNRYTEFFNALIPVGSGAIPDDETLDRYDDNDVHLFVAMCKRDEFHDYALEIKPREERLRRMKHCFLFTPEWTYSGNHGIQSIIVNIEIGQHCLINPIHANLKFDDGTVMDERLPRGITGWIDDVIHAE